MADKDPADKVNLAGTLANESELIVAKIQYLKQRLQEEL